MPWFQKLCRQTGLALHFVIHPDGKRREEIRRTVKEEKVSETVTLRRTTIEEIEVSRGNTDDRKQAADAP